VLNQESTLARDRLDGSGSSAASRHAIFSTCQGGGTHMNDSNSTAARLLGGGDAAIDLASGLLKAMANDNRLRILCLLDGQELSVTELNRQLALSQSALSQHLAILRRENLVTTRRASQTIYYSLHGDGARTIIEALGRLGLAD
jgi:ArsR family transcriptional regulator, virulence genes transcriptional regulator